MRSSRRPEDRSNRLEWRRSVRKRSVVGRLARLRENELRRQRRQSVRDAARRAETRDAELARLIAAQERDARTYRIKYGPEFLDAGGLAA